MPIDSEVTLIESISGFSLILAAWLSQSRSERRMKANHRGICSSGPGKRTKRWVVYQLTFLGSQWMQSS